MIVWLFGLVFVLLRLPSLFEPYWYGDEGIYLTIGQALRHGITLYSQIHDNKPPLLYYLAAINPTVFGFRLLLLLWMIPTIYVFYRLAKKFLSLKSALISTFVFLVLTSIPLIEGNIANSEIFMLLPTILGVILFLNSFNSKTPASSAKALAAAGLCLGIAFTLKIPVAFEFGFLFLWLFIFGTKHKFKNLLTFGLAFFTPIILWALYFAFKGALSQFITAAFLQNLGYVSSWTAGTQSAPVTSSGLPLRAVLLLLAWVGLWLLHRRHWLDKNSFFLLAWLAATIFGVLLSSRPYPHYLIQTLPPLCLIIVSLKKHWLMPFSLLFMIFILVKYQFYYYPVLSYYQNFYLRGNQKTYFNSGINYIYQISDYIDSHSAPTDRIFVWGDASYIYALANRLPASKYIASYHIVDYNGYQTTIDDLKTYFPKFIVYFSMPSRPFPDLDDFVSAFYYPIQSYNHILIYQRR